MAKSILAQLRELQKFRDDFLAGAYPQRSALGPGALSKNFIKSKSITASMMDVSELAAVATKTGSLSATGDIVVDGVIRSGIERYPDDYVNEGFWIGKHAGVPKLLVGSRQTSTSPRIDFDGTDLTVLGDINAETGYLKNLLVKGKLTMGETANPGVIAAGKTSYASTATGFWIEGGGGINPRVKIGSAGSYIDWSGSGLTIKGTINADDGYLNNLTVQGLLNLSGGSAVIRFGSTGNQITASGITTNNIDVNGGTLDIGGQFSVDGSGVLTASGATIGGTVNIAAGLVVGSVNVLTSGNIRSGKTAYGSGTGWILEYNSGSPRMDVGTSTSYLRWDGSKAIVRGRLEFGAGDYLENDVINLEVGTSSTQFMKVSSASYTPYAEMRSFIQSDFSDVQLNARGTDGTVASVECSAIPSLDRAAVSIIASTPASPGYGVSFNAVSSPTLQDNRLSADLADAGGSSAFFVRSSTSQVQFGVASNGTLLSNSNDTSGGSGSYYARIPVVMNYNGMRTTKYLRVYDS